MMRSSSSTKNNKNNSNDKRHFTFLLVIGSFLLTFLLSTVNAAAPPTTKNTARHIHVLNDSGGKVEIYWVHPHTRQATLMSSPDVLHGASFPLDSYVGHEFEVRELPSTKTGECRSEDKVCRSNFFEVSVNQDQVLTIKKGLELEFLDDQIRARIEAGGLVKECKENAQKRLENAMGDSKEIAAAMEDLVACVEVGVAGTLSKATEEIAFQSKVRREMAEQLENVTCADTTLETSEPKEETIWRGAADYKMRPVKIMLDRPASKIHVIENFISEDECKAMEEAAKPKLHRATVADGKGGSHFSEHRKAMQAGIRVPWENEKKGDPIARLSRRVYDYTNFVLGLGLEEHGQEDLMSIQYFGRGENETIPDRYLPHCDGDCAGLPFKMGTRMATMVMYCTLPEIGGHTNFRNANVHIKPKTGAAVFFSYIDPETLLTDNHLTQHSGCPVIKGEKKIVTQWIRYGVDEKNPWDSFNTLGTKKGLVD